VICQTAAGGHAADIRGKLDPSVEIHDAIHSAKLGLPFCPSHTPGSYAVVRSTRRPPELAGKIFTRRSAVGAGLLTPSELRGSAWRPLLHGIYSDATLAVSHRHLCLAAAYWIIPASGAIAGRSAAYLYGITTPAPGPTVDVLVPPDTRIRASGLAVHQTTLADHDMRVLRDIRVTTPVRTCWDLAQWLDPVEAMVLLDQMVRRRLVTIAEMEAYARARVGARGWRRALRAATLVDPGDPARDRARGALRRPG
jgi:hypothetical protein